MGVAHDDLPPPDHIGTDDAVLDDLRRRTGSASPTGSAPGSRSRTARSSTTASPGRGLMGATTLDLGVTEVTLQAVGLPDRRLAPEVGDGWVRFTQTTGGRTGVPLPRDREAPALRAVPRPSVWTTLAAHDPR